MAGTLVKVRFTMAYRNYRVGDEITPNGTLRDWLVANGYAEVVKTSAPVPVPEVKSQLLPRQMSKRGPLKIQ